MGVLEGTQKGGSMNLPRASLTIAAGGLIAVLVACVGLLFLSTSATVNYALVFVWLPLLEVGVNLIITGAARIRPVAVSSWILCFAPAFLLCFALLANSVLAANLLLAVEANLGIYAFILLFLTATSFKVQTAKPAELPAAMGENWRALFSTISSIKNGSLEVEKELSKLYSSYSQIKSADNQTLRDLVHLYQYSADLSDVPKDYVEPFQAKLKDALRHRGITEWTPEIGKPAPEGCRKVPCPDKTSLAAGTVVRVHQSGFRLASGEIIENPIVEVVTG